MYESPGRCKITNAVRSAQSIIKNVEIKRDISFIYSLGKFRRSKWQFDSYIIKDGFGLQHGEATDNGREKKMVKVDLDKVWSKVVNMLKSIKTSTLISWLFPTEMEPEHALMPFYIETPVKSF